MQGMFNGAQSVTGQIFNMITFTFGAIDLSRSLVHTWARGQPLMAGKGRGKKGPSAPDFLIKIQGRSEPFPKDESTKR